MASTPLSFVLGALVALLAVGLVAFLQPLGPGPSSYGEEIYTTSYLAPPPGPIFKFAMWLDSFFWNVPNKLVPPPFRILDISMLSFQRSILVRCAVQLGIAPALRAGPKSVSDLAAALQVKSDALDRVLVALTRIGVFQQLPDGRYANNALSAVLIKDHPSTVLPYLQYGEVHLFKEWEGISQVVRTGEVEPLEKYWERINNNPVVRELFADFMQCTATLGNQAVVEDYDFCKYSRVVDMGGGTGGLLKLLLASCPNTKGTIFELPEIAQDAEKKWKTEFAALVPRASFISGSFLETAPAISKNEAFVFRGVLHDWSDEKVVDILKHVRQSMQKAKANEPSGAADPRLVLVEFFPDQAPGAGHVSVLLDIQMFLIGGKERTLAQWTTLLNAHGFKVESYTKTRSPLGVLEASLA